MSVALVLVLAFLHSRVMHFVEEIPSAMQFPVPLPFASGLPQMSPGGSS